MEIRGFAKQLGRGLALTAAIVTTAVLTAPSPAQARVSDGAAIGIGLGAFALGSALGAGAYYGGSPYYGGGYGYPSYGYSYAPAYSYYSAPSYSYYGSSYAPSYGYYGSSYAPTYGYGWGW